MDDERENLSWQAFGAASRELAPVSDQMRLRLEAHRVPVHTSPRDQED